MSALEVVCVVVDQDHICCGPTSQSQEGSPEPSRGLGAKTPHGLHVLDADDPLELPIQPKKLQDPPGVLAGCIGQQPMPPPEATHSERLASNGQEVVKQVVMRVRLVEEIRRVDTVVGDQPQKGRTISPPVSFPQAAGLFPRETQAIHDVDRHASIDLGHEPVTGIVKGVVEVHQPDRAATTITPLAEPHSTQPMAQRHASASESSCPRPHW